MRGRGDEAAQAGAGRAEERSGAGRDRGPGLAFFDVDNTLVGVNSGRLWVRDAYRRGELSRLGLARLMVAAFRHRLGWLDARPLARRWVRRLEGQREDRFAERCARFFHREIRPHLRRGAEEVVERHRRRGDRPVLLTAGLPYVVGPLAELLGIEELACTRLEVRDGRFTGRMLGPMCYAEGKLEHARDHAARSGVELADCAFYTDSIRDLAVLEAVGEPVVVHPDPRLERIARKRGWPAVDLSRPGAERAPEGSPAAS